MLETAAKLKIGCVEYVNTLLFRRGLEGSSESGTFTLDYPTRLNAQLREGKFDIALISSLEYARASREYEILPPFCISTKKISGSVLLISRRPLEDLMGAKILLSEESLSSQVLLKILLEKRRIKNITYEVMPQNPKEMFQAGDGFLLIGDDALFYELPEGCYRYDLGSLWYETTGLPFCFALWTLRRDSARDNPQSALDFQYALETNFRKNQKSIGQWIDDARVLSYLSHLEFRLTDEVQKGLLKYFEFAKEIGEIAEVPELRFFTHD